MRCPRSRQTCLCPHLVSEAHKYASDITTTCPTVVWGKSLPGIRTTKRSSTVLNATRYVPKAKRTSATLERTARTQIQEAMEASVSRTEALRTVRGTKTMAKASERMGDVVERTARRAGRAGVDGKHVTTYVPLQVERCTLSAGYGWYRLLESLFFRVVSQFLTLLSSYLSLSPGCVVWKYLPIGTTLRSNS